MLSKAVAFAIWSAAFTTLLYLFGVFVSLETDVRQWAAPGRFLTAFLWLVAHFVLAVAAFGSKSSGGSHG